jgi:6-phosphogluconolactonase
MDTLVAVGTYSARGSEGIYTFRMDPGTGRLDRIGTTAAGKNPSFLAVDPSQRYLYAVSEVESVDGASGGGVRAFALDLPTGGLRFLNAQSSGGKGPCHVSVDATGRCVVVANFGGGSVAALPVRPDGSLGSATSLVQHPRPTIARPGQDAPHAHCAVVSPGNDHVFAADLGLDRVCIYRLDAASGTLRAAGTPWVELHPGAGPRHLVFHPSGGSAYVIDELDNTVSVYRYGGGGELEYLQRVPTLPEGWGGTSYCADIHVSPDGRFLYGSNRGHHSIVIYAVDPARGTLSLLGHESTRGEWPRSFAVHPAGRFVLVANEHSDSLVCFSVDPSRGTLTPTGQTVSVPAPVCVRMLRG